jgi:hypothetical protein
MSMENSMTPSGIEIATFRFVAQYLKHRVTAVPQLLGRKMQIMNGISLLILRYFSGCHIKFSS